MFFFTSRNLLFIVQHFQSQVRTFINQSSSNQCGGRSIGPILKLYVLPSFLSRVTNSTMGRLSHHDVGTLEKEGPMLDLAGKLELVNLENKTKTLILILIRKLGI